MGLARHASRVMECELGLRWRSSDDIFKVVKGFLGVMVN
jgi:hypothetical protein